MLKPETKQILEGVNATPFGRALREFLDEEMKKIESVKGCKSEAEMFGKQIAVDLIEKLFSFMKPQDIVKSKPRQYD